MYTVPGAPRLRISSHPAFAAFWCAEILAALAGQVQSITLGWQVYVAARATHTVEQSALLVGFAGLAQFFPLFLLTLLAGTVADRHDRRKIALLCTAIEIGCALTLAMLAWRGGSGLWCLFAIAAMFGTARAFAAPARTALGPMLVPREYLPTSISLIQLGDQASAIIGPSIGGVLCGISVALGYGVAALLHGGAVLALLGIRAVTRPRFELTSHWRHIREGLHYVWTHEVVRGAISLDLFAVLLGGVTALLPVYARDILHAGAHGFGALRAGPAIGAAAMAMLLARHPLRRRAGLWLFAGVAVYGVATLIFAVSTSLVPSIAVLAVLGAADMISVYVRQSLVQITTPDAMRGRVSAVAGLFIGGSAELGEFETGVAARLIGPVGAAIFGGVGSLVVTGAWAALFPALRNADRLDSEG
jgi:MFS family permease